MDRTCLVDIKEDPNELWNQRHHFDPDKIAILIQGRYGRQFGCRVSVCDIENILNQSIND